MELDNLDCLLLREIQRDGRQTNRELAATAGVAPSTTLERLRSLRRRGVLKGFTAEIDLEAIGRPVEALIAVRIRPPSRKVLEGFREWARTRPEVVGIFVTTGGDDFLIHMAVPDTDYLYDFIIDELTERREVADVRTSIVYERLEARILLPLDSRKADQGQHPGEGRRTRSGKLDQP
ncbi:Lrp/AsnC family transcriptional regulator [Streptomyces sp. B1866]|uniref:Lrp/AsnC family transcriptional regulator n=1 Tax=Streptomyces sp. B1866 TaxID=3075431 RepID=UPI002891DF1B|nr:Lrp/AsnC family transcriptional regulator [Streptomyces sp. B1866]MDT3396527.1 Lrp/AsnC family transcriptional regulator [Streptomyces sp. B1866]